jgi:hypothetical protein
MLNNNGRFSRWWAPVVGGAVIPYMMLTGNPPAPPTTGTLLIGAAVGAAVGLLVMLIDPGERSPRLVLDHTGREVVEDSADDDSLLARAIAVIGLLVCWAPFVGLILGLIAVAANWRVRGWPKIVAWVTLLLGIASTAVLSLALAL